MNIEEILNKIYTSELLSSEELHELTEWACNKDKEIERLKEEIVRIKDVYTSMQFSAPENMYIFIERLGEILDKENN